MIEEHVFFKKWHQLWVFLFVLQKFQGLCSNPWWEMFFVGETQGLCGVAGGCFISWWLFTLGWTILGQIWFTKSVGVDDDSCRFVDIYIYWLKLTHTSKIIFDVMLLMVQKSGNGSRSESDMLKKIVYPTRFCRLFIVVCLLVNTWAMKKTLVV